MPLTVYLKGLVHPKIKILSVKLTLMFFQPSKTFVHLSSQMKIFLIKSKSFRTPPLAPMLLKLAGPEGY